MRTLILPLFLMACGPTVIGSGTAATIETEIDGVGFENDSPAVARLTIGTATGVVVTCDDNLVEDFRVENRAGVVRLSLPDINALPRTDCTADVTLSAVDRAANLGSGGVSLSPDVLEVSEIENSGSGRLQSAGPISGLVRLDHHGSGGISLAGVDTCDLFVSHTGSGGMTVEDVSGCGLEIETTGSGSTQLSGDADTLDLAVRGSGGFGDETLVVGEARIAMSASGGAEVTVTDAVEVRLSGSGGARIHGQPEQRSVDDTGSGQVRFE